MSNNNSWEIFWKNHSEGFDQVMLKATQCFAERFLKNYPLSKEDRLLDFGCGPGYFLRFIPKDTSCLVGLDISEKYIDVCKNYFQKDKNFEFYVSEIFQYQTLQKVISEKNINKVVVLSVFQYYPDLNSVEKFLDEIRLSKGATKPELLIADILPPGHSMIRDAMDISKYAIKERYFVSFVRFVLKTLFSKYTSKDTAGLLYIPKSFFSDYAKKYSVKIEVTEQLTLHSGRYSVRMVF